MPLLKTIPLAAAAALALGAALPGAASAEVRDIVLVHGMNMDGGVWRAVYDRLVADDYNVTVAQLPLTSIGDDLAAARRTLDMQDGPVVLVGHSYGGMVVSQVGTDPKVAALVYVAAFQPELGESLASLNAAMPAALPADAIEMFADGHYLVAPEAWIVDVATGLPDTDARFTAMSQTASNAAIFGYEAEAAAWRDKPVWSAVAAQDRTVSPDLQRMMSTRSGATTVEIDGGHLLPMTHPDEIAALIEAAAKEVD